MAVLSRFALIIRWQQPRGYQILFCAAVRKNVPFLPLSAIRKHSLRYFAACLSTTPKPRL